MRRRVAAAALAKDQSFIMSGQPIVRCFRELAAQRPTANSRRRLAVQFDAAHVYGQRDEGADVTGEDLVHQHLTGAGSDADFAPGC